MKIEIVNGYKTVITYDKEERLYTMSCLERGGAIVSARTKNECSEKFTEAMGLAVSVAKLMEFSRSRTFNYKNK